MSQIITDIVEGWTGPLSYTLLADGDAQNLTGLNWLPVCEDKDGNLVSTSGDGTEDNTTGGGVSYNPNSTDTLQADRSPYTLQFLVFDVNDKGVYWPNEEPISLRIRPVGAR